MIQQLAQQNSGLDMSLFQPLPPPPPPLSPTSPECFRTPGQDGASGANVNEAGGSGGAHDPNVGDHFRSDGVMSAPPKDNFRRYFFACVIHPSIHGEVVLFDQRVNLLMAVVKPNRITSYSLLFAGLYAVRPP
ncbi:hypothetical protein GUJ93_ZPchr0002g23563 [Zizania palustris]|uniref:Uncharacterized protein n=1 Tax=Zizania palustris TaxID=103762 RepID=A0A8J5V3M1_ZIZPA|nr:hypothetical protein GUJ93_ZPchr0002g23563 [Zizania palustris]